MYTFNSLALKFHIVHERFSKANKKPAPHKKTHSLWDPKTNFMLKHSKAIISGTRKYFKDIFMSPVNHHQNVYQKQGLKRLTKCRLISNLLLAPKVIANIWQYHYKFKLPYVKKKTFSLIPSSNITPSKGPRLCMWSKGKSLLTKHK